MKTLKIAIAMLLLTSLKGDHGGVDYYVFCKKIGYRDLDIYYTRGYGDSIYFSSFQNMYTDCECDELSIKTLDWIQRDTGFKYGFFPYYKYKFKNQVAKLISFKINYNLFDSTEFADKISNYRIDSFSKNICKKDDEVMVFKTSPLEEREIQGIPFYIYKVEASFKPKKNLEKLDFKSEEMNWQPNYYYFFNRNFGFLPLGDTSKIGEFKILAIQRN